MKSKIILSMGLLIIMTSCSSPPVMNDFISVNRNLDFEQSKIKYGEHYDSYYALPENSSFTGNYKMIDIPIIMNITKSNETRSVPNPTYGVPGQMNSNNAYEQRTVTRTNYEKANFYILYENDEYLFSGFEYQIKLLGSNKVKNIFNELKATKNE